MSEVQVSTETVFDAFRRSRVWATGSSEGARELFEEWLNGIRAEAWTQGGDNNERQWEHVFDSHVDGEPCQECEELAINPYRREQ